LNPQVDTLCYYITYLAKHFVSSASVRNYVSGVSYLHKSLGITCAALQAFPVTCILRAVDVALRRPAQQKRPIDPKLLIRLVSLTKYIGAAGPPLKFALILAFFGMLRVSNLAPLSPAALDTSRDISRGDVAFKSPGLVVKIKWSKTLQTLGTPPLIPLPVIRGNPLDPVQAYKDLLATTPTLYPTQPLLTYKLGKATHVLTTPLLNKLLAQLLSALRLDPTQYSFHSLRRGGATTAYHGGVNLRQIMRHGLWATQTSFWQYVTQPIAAASPVAVSLAAAARSANR
jgi:integrase